MDQTYEHFEQALDNLTLTRYKSRTRLTAVIERLQHKEFNPACTKLPRGAGLKPEALRVLDSGCQELIIDLGGNNELTDEEIQELVDLDHEAKSRGVLLTLSNIPSSLLEMLSKLSAVQGRIKGFLDEL